MFYYYFYKFTSTLSFIYRWFEYLKFIQLTVFLKNEKTIYQMKDKIVVVTLVKNYRNS